MRGIAIETEQERYTGREPVAGRCIVRLAAGSCAKATMLDIASASFAAPDAPSVPLPPSGGHGEA